MPLQIARHMPVQLINGRAKSFAVIGKMQPGVARGACLDYTLQDYEIEQATYIYGELVSAFQTCSTTQDITGGPNNLNNALRKKAERRLQQLFWELIDTGVAGSGSFLGLAGLLPAGQKVVVGGVPTLAQFDQAFSLVVDNEAHPTAIMSNWGALRRYLDLLRTAGLKPDLVETQWAEPIRASFPGKSSVTTLVYDEAASLFIANSPKPPCLPRQSASRMRCKGRATRFHDVEVNTGLASV